MLKDLKKNAYYLHFLEIFDYLVITHLIKFNTWIQVLFTFITFVNLKIIYKEKANITDIFTFTIASIILIIISAISYLIIWKIANSYILAVILNRLLLIIFLLVFHKKLPKIKDLYGLLWNRNDTVKKHMKTTTFRFLNITVFNILFYIIHLGMVFTVLLNGGV